MGLGIAILLGMWPCMYVDVNECNVCSVCVFLIWDLGFIVSYCEGCENGFARSKACHSYSLFVCIIFIYFYYYLFFEFLCDSNTSILYTILIFLMEYISL